MGRRLYVGNLSYDVTEGELRATFEACGSVDNINLMIDRETGRPRGFAFVEMGDDEAARNAVTTLNGQMLLDRAMRVDEARPAPERAGGGGGGSRRGGYNGGGGGGRRSW